MSETELFDIDVDADTVFTIQFLGTIILCGAIYCYYYYTSNKESILEMIDKKMIEWKESLEFYTNQLLLKLNMQGSAVKTTQFL